MEKKNPLRYLIYIIILFIFFMPLFRLLILSFKIGTTYGLGNYIEIFKDIKTYESISNTIYISVFSTVISLCLGLIMAWLIAYTDVRQKNLMEFFVLLPFVIPSYIITLSWTQFMGKNGIVEKILSFLPGNLKPLDMYSLTGIILVMGICNSSLVYLLTVNVFRRIPRDLEWSARTCGLSALKTFFKINLPLAMPGIISGGILSFLASIDNFGIPAFLGIPAGISVLSTYIYESIIGFGPKAFSKGAAISVILAVIAILGTAFQGLLLKKSNGGDTVKEDYNIRFSLGKGRKIIEFITWIFLIIINIIPIISMVLSSLINAYGMSLNFSNLTLKHYSFILHSPNVKNALINSFILALTCTIICIFIGTLIAYIKIRKSSKAVRFIELNMSLAYAVPGIVLALAMIFHWIQPIPGWKPDIYGTIKIMVIAYITRYLILQVKGSSTAISQVDESMEEAAIVCGANSYFKWIKILVPMILTEVISGSFLIFMSSLTELTLSSLLSSVGTETIGLTILNFQQGGDLNSSTALSSLVIFIISLLYFSLKIVPKFKFKGGRI
ncbi:iron ABC transporter permease [Clostridium sp. DJ247]|uniref:ABC transporter permease n=1 Tax=Clostridium sp. DJ247 TaxID=2726188 RepID=UPI00162440DA|nr:iron ABC transporter permease [Clostridium sp. DJ247]MBC2578745.1 iron ABC transporter permease [Clostridium sp. DJ247]